MTRRFALTGSETSALGKNGFVVPARLEQPTYADALHEVYQSELPLFVSADAVLHAVYAGNEQTRTRLEERRLAPLLRRTLAVMHCALAEAAAGYPDPTARDLDVYLTVARTMLADHPVAPTYNESAGPAAALVARARAAVTTTSVLFFGQDHHVDFTAFRPRGRYATMRTLTPYFRAATWLGRVAADAPALANLATSAGVIEGVRALRQAWAAFGGKARWRTGQGPPPWSAP